MLEKILNKLGYIKKEITLPDITTADQFDNRLIEVIEYTLEEKGIKEKYGEIRIRIKRKVDAGGLINFQIETTGNPKRIREYKIQKENE